MSLPTHDTDVVAEGLGQLLGQFHDKPVLNALLSVLLARQQGIEDMLWSVIDAGLLSTPPTGNALDQLGALVDEPRGTFNDAEYLLFIKVAIRARRSGGRIEDTIAVCALVLGPEVLQPNVAVVPSFDVEEDRGEAAAYDVTTLDIDGDYANPMGRALSKAKPAGVDGVFRWSDWDPAIDLVWGDHVTGTLASGLRDRRSGAYPTVPISAIQL